MQSAVTTLPKLNPGRNNTQAAPKLGHGKLVLAFKSLLRVGHPALELCPSVILATSRRQHRALLAGPGTNAAPPRTRVKVRLALLAREPRRHALDVDLPLQGRPVEAERGVGIGREIGRLLRRAKVGVYDIALAVELLEIHHARGDPTRGQLGG